MFLGNKAGMSYNINKLVALNQICWIGTAQLDRNMLWNQLVGGFGRNFNGCFFEKQSRNVL